MPATYAAASAVLRLVMERITASEPPMKLATLLDLGAGLGSVLWAVAENVPSIGKARLMDSSSGMIQFGKALVGNAPSEPIQDAEWIAGDVRDMSLDPHDLVVCSYSLGELPSSTAATTLHAAWKAAQEVLVIIEPGTPAGFARIREWRHQLISLGAHIVAPCPHALSCPVHETDWCHFAQRVERTSLHRKLKGGSLGYEDEKFSYVAVSKIPVALPSARIVRHPQIAPGAIKLELCATTELSEVIATKKDKEQFRRARHAKWGDVWESELRP
jgi:ribosomal protein RSM22 (predicted rRNA methylase)